MYISKLQLYGFKSFLKKSEINFGRGVTCVVGPNGCGKTNIVDAIRWVIGEQKARVLRADRSTDVIFNGTSKRKPLNIAEVSLTIHNVSGRIPIDYTDIEITRRIYRNGDSEYLLNKNICRLKDIRNLFIDTGMGADAYSIIELKMIENILSENPHERKNLFEEAAGVNKYREQRKAALRKLDATEEDMVRVTDIIGEVDDKVKTLKRQLRQYERYQKVSGDVIEAEVLLAASRITALKKEKDPLESQIKTQRNKLVQISDTLQKLEDIAENKQTEHDNIEIKLNKQTNRHNECREKRNHAQTEELLLKEQYQHKLSEFTRLNEEITSTTTRIEKIKQRISQLDQEEKKYEKQLQNQQSDQKKFKDQQTGMEQAFKKASEELDLLQDRKYVLIRQQSEQLAKQNALQENISFLENEIAGIEKELSKKNDRRIFLGNQVEEARDKVSELQEELEDLQTDLAQAEEELEELTDKQEKLLTQKRDVDSRLDQLNNKIDFYADLLETKEGFSPALQYVLKHKEKFSGIVGSFAENINVADDYTEALKSVLGQLSNLLITENLENALAVVQAVEKLKQGRLSVIALENENGLSKVETPCENLVPLADLVTCPAVIKPVMKRIFANVFFCQDEDFESIIKNEEIAGKVIVSKSGRICNEQAIIFSNLTEQETDFVFGREEKLFHLESNYDKLKLEKVGLDEDLEQVNRTLQQSKLDIRQYNRELNETNRSLQDVKSKINNHNNELEQLQVNIQELKRKKINETNSLDSFRNKLADLDQAGNSGEQLKELEAKIQDKKITVDEVKTKHDRFIQNLQNFRVELVKIRNRFDNIRNEKTSLSTSLVSLEKRLKNKISSKQEIKLKKNEMEQSIERKKLAVENTFREEKIAREAVEKIRVRYEEIKTQLQETNKEIYKIRHQKEILTETINKLELEHRELLSRQREVESILYEKYERKVDFEELEEVPVVEIAIQKRDRLKKRLENIGTINMAVKDEYEQEADRLNFLKDQKNDLVEAAETVRRVIKEIDTVAREKFLETFTKIKENFKNIFQIFFPGGSTDINLIGDGDPLDSKIEIFACPGGKKMLSLRMLSAGEKTLTAIALLFGIYQVKPSPFCILDEVDAPLDDANTRRFTKLLKTFANETQFIIVTHNKVTMSVADVLFGVTMGEKGVSQIVSVNLD
ncbi:MAG: chromosome segregation protein SMC [Fidelibacterota bacterium]